MEFNRLRETGPLNVEFKCLYETETQACNLTSSPRKDPKMSFWNKKDFVQQDPNYEI